MKLQHKITITMSVFITAIIIAIAVLMSVTWLRSIQNQVALDAMDQAIIIAEIPEIQESIVLENGYIVVNKLVERIHLKTGIQYLYILNNEGRYFAHPLPGYLNTFFAPTDIKMENLPDSPAYFSEMTSNAMVEGYAPIYTDGIRSGTVVVGIFNGRILQSMKGFAMQLVFFVLGAIIVGLAVSYRLSANIKKSIYDLEPEEIAVLLKDREVILENIGNGLMAIDHEDKISLINSKAKKLLNQKDLFVGTPANRLRFYDYLKSAGAGNRDFEWRVDANTILKIDVISLDEVDTTSRSGALYRIEDLSQMRQRAEELTNMKQLTQTLRIQAHEFMNKLHTISGLIQLESYGEALKYIEHISETRQAIISLLNEKIKVEILSGLILAKYAKATKHNIELNIDDTSTIKELPEHMNEHEASSLLGNLLDNAIDALTGMDGAEISLSIHQDMEQMSIIVRDNGPGITQVPVEECLKKGFSTKGPDRGYGLDIVNETVQRLGGSIALVNDNGLVCTVILPMKQEVI